MNNQRKLERWSFRTINGSGAYIYGLVNNQPIFISIEHIDIVLPAVGLFTTIYEVNYLLGEADPNYEKIFPDAKRKLLQSIINAKLNRHGKKTQKISCKTS